jgi:hypothetical protein
MGNGVTPPLAVLLLCCIITAAAAAAAVSEDTWVIQLEDGVDPIQFAASHNLVHVEPFAPLDNYHVFSASIARTRRVNYARETMARTLASPDSGAVWSERQTEHTQYKRTGGSSSPRTGASGDPMWGQQWHLHGTGPASVDITVGQVREGNGITIGVVDDGLQHTHPELANRYDSQHSWDFNGGDADPTPSSMDGHGTCAAAVAVAEAGNGHCGQGVAPRARVAGIRAIAGPISDLTEARALSHHSNKIDIYSCSWGPADTGTDMVGPGRVVRETLASLVGAKRGRNGKGSIYVWASGNGRHRHDSCAYDGYASSPYTIAVGALNYQGRLSYYSEGCSGLMGVAPSSGAGKGITTADLSGPAGYASGECTTDFGGTSSAAPLAAGIIALLLEERPELTWRDVQHVIAKGATRIHTHHTSWSAHPSVPHSNRYGFGLLKVPPLLEAAAHHTLVPDQVGYHSTIQRAPRTGAWVIPNTPSAYYAHEFTVQQSHINTHVEHVMVSMHLTHPRRGEVAVYLTSPSGTQSILARKRDDRHSNYPRGGWTYTSVHHWGEPSADGVWTLRFRDTVGSNPYHGYVNWVKLSVCGY